MKRFFLFVFLTLLCFGLHAQTPQLTTSLPTSELAGNQVCFDLTFTNSGNPGYNPYIRLILPEHLHFDSAQYYGMGVDVTLVGTFPSSGTLTDPKTGTDVSGPENGTFYILQPPIGTLVENGPTVVINVCVTIDSNAQVNVPLEVISQPVYELGDTPTGENGPIEGNALTENEGSYITPQLWRLTKSVQLHELETVPGPDFQFEFTLVIDVADGKTVNNVLLSDVLDNAFQYTGNLTINGGTNAQINQEPDTASPGGTLEVHFDSISGTTSDEDAKVSFTLYVRDVVSHTACEDKNIENTATADGEFPLGTTLPQITSTQSITAHNVEVQKSASPSDVAPGDTVTYSFNFQVSDYETATALVLTDTIPDGIAFDSHQSLVVNGTSYSITPTVTNNSDGTTTVVYDIHSVTGDLAPGTTGTLSYTGTVLQTYHDGSYVLSRDTLSSGVYITYSVQGGASDCQEVSSASVSVKPVAIQKTIINPQAEYLPGETVRFKLTMTIPSGDTKNVVFKDFFPLPVFDVTTIDTTWGNDIKLASDDTWGHQPDSINVSASQNLLELVWNDINTEPTQEVVISVEVDIKVVEKPFADNLLLTNVFEGSTENSSNVASLDLRPTPIKIRNANLVITKGVYSVSNSSGVISPSNAVLPVDGDVSGVDGGDTVDFYITVENQGGAPAYDVIIDDPAVVGLVNAQIVSVKDGDGNDLAYRDPNDVDPPASPTLPIPTTLENGIRLDNPLAANDGTIGEPYSDDTVIIHYRVEIDGNVEPEQAIVNTAGAVWASQSGAEKFPRIEDDSIVNTALPSIVKTVESITPGPNTSISSDYVTTGDTVVYNIRVNLPEGNINNLRLYDRLPAGFEYQSYSIDTSSFGGSVDTTPTVNVNGTVDSGIEINFNFDGVNPTVVNTDNDETNNFFDLKITCLVKDSSANNGYPSPQQKVNYSRIYADNITSEVSSQATVYFVEPHLTVTKTMSPSSGLEAGDTVTVTIQVANNGSGNAYDVSVSDTLNQYGDIFDLSTVAEGTTPSNYSFNYSSPTVTYTMNSGLIAPNQTDTFTFTVQVKDDVVLGSTYRNNAVVNGDNQSGTNSEERNYNVSDSANAHTQRPYVRKDVIATSESFTSDPYVAIGEIVTYRIRVNIPEGVLNESSSPLITDSFPSGFEYINNSAVIYGEYETSLQASNYGAIPVSATAITPTVNGNTLEFDLGSITNNDNDSNTERIYIEYKMLVKNVSSNNRGSSYVNHAYVNYSNADGNPQSRSRSATVVVAEPDLNVSKSANPTTVTGGTITYTVIVLNQNSTASTYAWEPVISDTLPSELTNLQLSSATLSRGNQDVSAGASISGNTLTLDLSSLSQSERYLAPGDYITLVYTAEITGSATFEQIITNTAEILATSLPGDNGTGNATPGTPGSDTGERIGDGSLNTSGDAVNDLNASGSSSVSVAQPTLAKSGGDNLQIGDITTNTITLSVPVGTTDNFVVNDSLPSGLEYTGTPITISIPSSVSTTNNPDTSPGAGTNPLVFDFGSVTNDSGQAQTITITYEVQAINASSNQRGVILTNTAELNYQGASSTIESSTSSNIIEPNLEITSEIISGAAGSDAGDTVTYRITVSNTDSQATAYAVDLSTLLPADLLGSNPAFFNIILTNNDNVQKTAGGVLEQSDYSIDTTNNQGDTLTWDLFNLPPNTSITIEFSVQVVDTATSGETLTVETNASYRSQQTSGSETRDFTDGGDDDDDSQLNNYNEQASSDLTLNSAIAIQKTLSPGQPDSTFTIGDTVSFDLRVDIVEGTVPNVQVIDNLPSGMSFVRLVSIIADNNISYDGTGTATETGNQITIDMGNVTNVADSDTTNDYFIVRIEAMVDDVSSNTAGSVLTNNAEVHSDSGNAGPVNLDITVGEPHLVITKTASDTTPPIGKEITFSVTVEHSSSTADAYDVKVSDAIPAGMTYVAGSTTGQASVDESDLSNPVFDLGNITLTEGSKTFQFKVKINEDWIPGNSITNTVNLEYDGQSGSPSVERSYSDSGSETVTPTAETFIDAVKTVALVDDADGDGSVSSGDTLEYTITLNNTDGDLTGVVFYDNLPSEITYVSNSLTTSQGTVEDSNPTFLVVNIGDMASNDSITIVFRATVNPSLSDGTVISNQGYVESDQTIREYTDEDGIDSNGDQPTEVAVGGQNTATPLYVWKFVDLVQDNDSSDSITAGDVVRYYFVFYNDGNQPLTGVSLNDTIPAGLTPVGGSEFASSGTISLNGNTISLTGMSVASGENEYAYVDVTIDQPLYDSDGDPSSETFTNQGTADSNETESVLTDGNGDSSDGNQPTVFVAGDGTPSEPIIDVEKRWSLSVDNDGDGVVDPGDTINYTIYIYNNGSVDAQNVRLNDTIPANTSIVSGSVVVSNGVVVSENPVDVNLTVVGAGSIETVSFKVVVDSGVSDGTVISNQASVDGDNFNSVLSDDNGNDNDGINPTLTPVSTDSTTGGNYPYNLTKEITGTSNPDTQGNNVAIGETITYRVAFNVSPGTVNEILFKDTLPDGTTYVAGSARLMRIFDAGLSSSANPGDINNSSSGNFVSLSDGSDITINGNVLEIFFGDVINTDNDANDEGYVVEYSVLVENVDENQQGTVLRNAAVLTYNNALGQPQSLPEAHADAVVVEPDIVITKEAVSGGVGSSHGDTIRFKITIRNLSGSTYAYNVNLYDVLPHEFMGAPDGSGGGQAFSNIEINTSSGVVVTATGVPVSVSNIQIMTTVENGDTISIVPFTMPTSSYLELLFDVVVHNDADLGSYIENNAYADYTSLPVGGRNGSDGTSGLNDYSNRGGISLQLCANLHIHASAENGTVEPEDTLVCDPDATYMVRFTPDPGYHLGQLIVNGENHCFCRNQSTFTFYGVRENSTVHVVFVKSENPIINSFVADKLSGVAPLTVNFSVEAYDPDGGNTIKFKWDFDGDGTYDFEGYHPSASHIYSVPGVYHAKVTAVDEEGAETESFPIEITVSQPNPVFVSSGLISNVDVSGTGLWIVNNNPSSAEITLEKISESGAKTPLESFTLPPFGKKRINVNGDSDDSCIVSVISNQRLIYYLDKKTESMEAGCYVGANRGDTLIIPHIAEEKAYWDTKVFASSSNFDSAVLEVGAYKEELPKAYFREVYLNPYVEDNQEVSTCWGLLESKETSPFGENVLTGYLSFVKKGLDGAFVGLPTEGYKFCILPHIPVEKELFWTGFAVVNLESVDEEIKFFFYDSQGQYLGAKSIVVNAMSKYKGLFKDTFPEFYGEASWCKVESEGKFVLTEIFGVFPQENKEIEGGAICGMLVSPKVLMKSVLPFVNRDDEHWTGIAVANPNETDTGLKIVLKDSEGNKLAVENITIPPLGQFKVVIDDLFPAEVARASYILLESTAPVSACEISGDYSYKVMKAITSSE